MALKINPDFADARYNLGAALLACGRTEEAIAPCRKAAESMPRSAAARKNLGIALASSGRTGEAIAQFRNALEIDPRDAEAHQDLGVALARCGQSEEAIGQLRKALALKPDYAMAWNDLAWLRATCPEAVFRDGREAIELARKAIGLAGETPDFLDTLAAAYAEAGMFAQAKATVRHAWELARRQNNAPLAAKLQARRRLYDAGNPYRETRKPPPSTSAK